MEIATEFLVYDGKCNPKTSVVLIFIYLNMNKNG